MTTMNTSSRSRRTRSRDPSFPPGSTPSNWVRFTDYLASTRFFIAVLMFFGMFISYAYRAFLSVVILRIANEYGYTNEDKGYLSGAFFIGYTLLQLPAGLVLSSTSTVSFTSVTTGTLPSWYIRYMNGYTFLLVSIFLPSLCTLVTPFVVSNLSLFILFRILTGLFESLFYPTIHDLTSLWYPYDERSRIVGFIWSGAYVGTCASIYLSGLIIQVSGLWSMVFYIFGLFGVGWSIVWYVWASPLPETHPRIRSNEKEYILALRRRIVGESSWSSSSSSSSTVPSSSSTVSPLSWYHIVRSNTQRIPWKLFLKHPAVWAIIVQHTTHNYIFYMLLTWLPLYLEKLFDTPSIDISVIALFTFVPYLCCFVASLASGYIADDLIKHKILPTVQVRKLMQFIAEIIPAGALVGVCFLTYKPFILFLLTIAIGCLGFNGGGYSCSHFDIAPSYGSFLMGLGNTFATLPGIIAPIIVGLLTREPHNDLDHYRIAFILASIVTIIGYIVFYVYAEGEILPFLREGTEGEEGREATVISNDEEDKEADGEEDNDADIDEDDDEGNRETNTSSRSQRAGIRKEEEIKLLRVK